MAVRQSPQMEFAEAARMDRMPLWSPLPGVDSLSADARARLRESDNDIRQDRLESALDASMAVNAIAPEYIPGFIRTTELLFATHRRDRARTLTQTIVSHQETLREDRFELQLAKLFAHVNPSPDNTLRVAWAAIERNDPKLIVPYVPAAIDSLVSHGRTEEAVDLAESWRDAQPDKPLAIAYLVREYLRDGRTSDCQQAMRDFRDSCDADRIWPENLALTAFLAVFDMDQAPNWLVAGPVCKGLRDQTLDYRGVAAVMEFIVPILDDPHRTLILAGLFAAAAGDHSEAEGLFQTVEPQDRVESYLTGIGLERIARTPSDDMSRIRTLSEVFKTLGDPSVLQVADSSDIFEPPATRKSVGLELANILKDQEQYPEALEILGALAGEYPNDSEILRSRAEIMGRSGSKADALRELDQLATQHEDRRNYSAAVGILETMVKLTPGNISLRNRIVDNCVKVGHFSKAIDQLVMQGRLLHRAGKVQDAEIPLHRAIEIASMTGEWETVTKLHRLLISFDPNATRLRHAAVTTYVQHGLTDAALTQLREIARIAQKNGDPDEAIAASHQMIALNPNDPQSYHQLGELLASIQEYGQADRVYRRLAALAPDDPAVKAKRSAIAAMAKDSKRSG